MRYKCIVSYDGTLFHGFQVQGRLRTVQSEIEAVLLIILKKRIKIYGAGRTDTGVHAYGQVFHFDTDIIMKAESMRNAINSRLPKDIYITKIELVDDEFHSRYNAKRKTYKYLIDIGEYNPLLNNYRYYYQYKIDIEKLISASNIFIGEHDFSAFTKNNKLSDKTRKIFSLDIEVQGDLITISIHGDGFMHNMIRIIIAMLLEVARGRISMDDLVVIMESKNRKLAPKIVPPNGLYLVNVEY